MQISRGGEGKIFFLDTCLRCLDSLSPSSSFSIENSSVTFHLFCFVFIALSVTSVLCFGLIQLVPVLVISYPINHIQACCSRPFPCLLL